MLRLHDPMARALVDVVPATPGRLTVFACGSAQPRELLVADLVRRVAERANLRVTVAYAGPDDAHLAPLNVHPPDVAYDADCAEALDRLGVPADVHVGAAERVGHDERVRAEAAAAGQPRVRLWLHVAAGPGHGLADVVYRGHDPLALRLALLTHHYRQPADLSWDAVAAAGALLARWRDRVAEWAESPSKPMCAEYDARFRDAWDTDLGTPAALDVARELDHDAVIPAGSKFETFAAWDHLLGLDLARDVGRPRTAVHR